MSLTGLVFLLAYLSGLGLGLVYHPRYALYAYLAVFYLHPPSRWWGAFLPDLRWSLLAGIVAFLATLRLPPSKSPVKWTGTTPARLLIVFTAWMWIQNLWALAAPEHLEASILFTKYLLLFYIIYRVLDSLEEVRDVMLLHVMGCLYLGWLAYLAPSVGRLEGVGGPGIDEANALGMFASTGAICASMLILTERSWRRWLCVLAMPFILNTLVQSESRGSMLGLIAAGLVLYYLRPRGYRMQFYAYAAVGAGLFGYLAQDVFWDRMNTMRASIDDQTELDGSAENRVVLAKAQLQMFKAYPLGAGHRGTAELSPKYLEQKWLSASPTGAPAARSSHSTLMSALVEQGVPGIGIFSALMIWLARAISSLKKCTRPDSTVDGRIVLYGASAAASLTLVFVAGVFTDYIKTEVQIWMFAILSLITMIYIPAAQGITKAPPAAKPAPRLDAATHARTRVQS
jgi:hypothetical protein